MQSVLLVLDGGLEGRDSLLALLLLMINHFHQVIKLVLALSLVLSRHHLHVRFSVVNVGFRAKRFLQRVDLQCKGNQIFFLTIKHVIPNSLRQSLVDV